MKVGLVQGYGYGDKIDNNHQIHKIYSKNPEINIKKLLAKRYDIAIIYEEVANYLVPKMSIEDTIKSLGVTDYVDIYIAFSQNNPQSRHFLNLYNLGFKEIIEDGTYDKIIQQWHANFTKK